VNDGQLETLAFERKDGRIAWRKPAPAEKLKSTLGVDTAGGATPTPVTDGNSVFVYFGSFGLIAYDLEGHEQWRQPLAPLDIETSASPILIDDKLIVVSDRETGSFIEAHDKKTGRRIWRTERPQFHRSSSTPFHWVNAKREEVILAGSLRLTSYNPLNGEENWHYNGTAKVATGSPTADENLLFTASTKDGRDGNLAKPTTTTPLPNAAKKQPLFVAPSENDNEEELSPVSKAPFLDYGLVTQLDPAKAGKGILAIQSCGRGDITQTHLAWTSTRSIPYASSPLLYHGRLFTVKDGGFVSAYDAKTGHSLYQDERLDAPGDYYASAVAADKRIYLSSFDGVVTVIDATSDSLKVLAQNKFEEQILATPALADRSIIVRTATTLYSFGANP
jgi:outer membrane protein assembly factor BamB